MYLAVDIGGTKVLMATFDESGALQQQFKFPTPPIYADFLQQFKNNLPKIGRYSYTAAGVAIPGVVDRVNGVGLHFGNLSWVDVPIKKDLEAMLGCSVALENDAKAGALYEAFNVRNEFNNVLYIAIGTGIGIAYVSNGIIDTTFGDRGGNRLMLEHEGKVQSWESFTSGSAIVKRFGKKASEINDPVIWKAIAHNIVLGVIDLIGLFDTEIVIFGGGVGAHFDKYATFLEEELAQYDTPIMQRPKLAMANNPEEAVIYGCYHLAKGAL